MQIANTPRDYAWGSRTAMAALFGRRPSGRPEAELWLGSHPGSPARVVGTGTPGATLVDVLGGRRLPFLLKTLAADAPLSLQAHPTTAQAHEGYARETAAGVRLDAAERNYRDPFHKPELIYALSERFEALCGFRSVDATRAVLGRLGDAARPLAQRLGGEADLRAVLSWLLAGGADVGRLVADVVRRAGELAEPSLADDIGLVSALAAAYPGDPGILVALLLNRVSLRRGEALYLPAGNIHAYLSGLGIEIMAASDNVLRGGLTSKHIDVAELERVLDARSTPVPYLRPVALGPVVQAFRPDVPDFELLHVTGDAELALPGAAIALCTGGRFAVAGAGSAGGGGGVGAAVGAPLADAVADAAGAVARATAAAGSADGSSADAGSAVASPPLGLGLDLGPGEAVFVLEEPSLVVRGAGELFVGTSALPLG
ncbi:MAG: mannose-6-phosphate isomerase, class I [Microbacteriaceae bacterium]